MHAPKILALPFSPYPKARLFVETLLVDLLTLPAEHVGGKTDTSDTHASLKQVLSKSVLPSLVRDGKMGASVFFDVPVRYAWVPLSRNNSGDRLLESLSDNSLLYAGETILSCMLTTLPPAPRSITEKRFAKEPVARTYPMDLRRAMGISSAPDEVTRVVESILALHMRSLSALLGKDAEKDTLPHLRYPISPPEKQTGLITSLSDLDTMTDTAFAREVLTSSATCRRVVSNDRDYPLLTSQALSMFYSTFIPWEADCA